MLVCAYGESAPVLFNSNLSPVGGWVRTPSLTIRLWAWLGFLPESPSVYWRTVRRLESVPCRTTTLSTSLRIILESWLAMSLLLCDRVLMRFGSSSKDSLHFRAHLSKLAEIPTTSWTSASLLPHWGLRPETEAASSAPWHRDPTDPFQALPTRPTPAVRIEKGAVTTTEMATSMMWSMINSGVGARSTNDAARIVRESDLEVLSEANEKHPGSAALALADLGECLVAAEGMGLAPEAILGLLRVAEEAVRERAGLVGAGA